MALQEKIHHTYKSVMSIYAELGYPEHLINSWVLPENDACTLLGKVEERRPQNALEVGSYVGLTTCLMALHMSDKTRIHSIDPNFPLRTEMSAMGSKLYECNVEIKTQELGQEVARRLGLHERVFFHAGGFAVSSTFASTNADPDARVPVIGETICTAHGPFDFIFIDALHYEAAVFADLSLAAAYLIPDGVIAIHDIKGRWGSNVRRAVFRFLAEHDDFVFSHAPFTALYDAIGFLWRRTAHLPQADTHSVARLQTCGLLQSTILSNLSATLLEMFAPKRVMQLSGAPVDVSAALLTCGVEQVDSVPLDTLVAAQAAVQRERRDNGHSPSTPETKYDLCLCLGVADALEPERVPQLIQACVDASDRVIFGFTPPGEMGAAYPNLHPTTYWMKQFLDHGYVFKDTIRPRLEPLTHADVGSPDYQMTGTYLLNLYQVEKEPGLAGAACDRALLEELLLSKESRIEDLTLQSLTQNLSIFDARAQLHSAQQALQYVQQEQQRMQQALQALQAQCDSTQVQLADSHVQLQAAQAALANTQAQLTDSHGQLQATQAALANTQAQLTDSHGQLQATQAALASTQAELQTVQMAFADYRLPRLVRLTHKLVRLARKFAGR